MLTGIRMLVYFVLKRPEPGCYLFISSYFYILLLKMNAGKHEKFMKAALGEATKAFDKDEVPIGAVVVLNDEIIARAYNLTETLKDPTAHAEMQAITAAANWLGGKYLTGCTIYVTVEPCAMCASAIGWSQAPFVVYGAPDEKKGYTTIGKKLLHPKTKVIHGILEDECREIMIKFFKRKR
jgi:tRNA(adenine34) deaminase